ncbi:enterochelin esterase [Propionibacteriaceae bacterium Y1700]|uniref:enterochelin esterase n=1 Tax=Microlunatus sp. Y1700 TaxID=3418487 RepID=UPI003DA6FD90
MIPHTDELAAAATTGPPCLLSLADLPDGHALRRPDVGSPQWWSWVEQTGTPLIQQWVPGRDVITFLLRDAWPGAPAVLADIGGMGGHQDPMDNAMERVPGTDVLWCAFDTDDQWRGSYSFLPMEPGETLPDTSDPDWPEQRRPWWLAAMRSRVRDPNNGVTIDTGRGPAVSVGSASRAPRQKVWTVDHGQQPEVARLTWRSGVLANERSIWVQQAPGVGEPVLVVVSDGQRWVDGLGATGALAELHARSTLPPTTYVFVDSLDHETRGRELPCHPDYWPALVDEALPLVAEVAPVTSVAGRTLVNGQSFGGLAAVYAGLTIPERFGNVVCQSGSFWWPDVDRWPIDGEAEQPSSLQQRVRAGELPAAGGGARFWLSAGDGEGDMSRLGREMTEALLGAGLSAEFEEYAGGHDWACWRGGLTDALTRILPEL